MPLKTLGPIGPRAVGERFKKEILNDIKNTAIILCDLKLEEALNINGLHVKDVKECVLKQLVLSRLYKLKTLTKKENCVKKLSLKKM
jgi:hypothetical protein